MTTDRNQTDAEREALEVAWHDERFTSNVTQLVEVMFAAGIAYAQRWHEPGWMPTEPGWYWWRTDEDAAEIVRVWHDPAFDALMIGGLNLKEFSLPCYWSGPLPVPVEPKA